MGLAQKIKENLDQTVFLGLVDFFRSGTIHSPLLSAAFHETPEQVIYSSGVNFAPCNGLIEKSEGRSLSDNEIDEAIEFFKARKLPFIWWTSDKSLENKGFQFGGILKGIAIDISKGLQTPAANTPNIKIKLAQTEQELKDFTQVVINSFGMDTSLIQPFFTNFSAAYKSGEQLHFLGYCDDIPVSSLTLAVSTQSAGLWNGGTLPDYRRKGISKALAYAAVAEAQKRNYTQIMAILMPKGMAWGVSQRLGFKEVSNFPFYVHGANATELEN